MGFHDPCSSQGFQALETNKTKEFHNIWLGNTQKEMQLVPGVFFPCLHPEVQHRQMTTALKRTLWYRSLPVWHADPQFTSSVLVEFSTEEDQEQSRKREKVALFLSHGTHLAVIHQTTDTEGMSRRTPVGNPEVFLWTHTCKSTRRVILQTPRG